VSGQGRSGTRRTPAAASRRRFLRLAVAGVLGAGGLPLCARAEDVSDEAVRKRFLALLLDQPDAPSLSLQWLDANWRDEFVPMALEIVRFVPLRSTTRDLFALVARKTGAPDHGTDWAAWMRWQWARAAPPPSFAAFKAALYAMLDPRFERYFSGNPATLIRLDEVVWGGVLQDGIPPLREPRMLAAAAARYLADGDVVFGVEINGDARAYPKRILAWHEMFVDQVGGIDVAGVYCTLCGAVIVYETNADGMRHRLGTSGFVYRSNKLMYDAQQAANKPVLVDVYADWCPTCKQQEPLISALIGSPEFKDYTVLKVNFDTQKDVRQTLRVNYQSTLIVFRGKREVARSTGDTNKDSIAASLRKGLS